MTIFPFKLYRVSGHSMLPTFKPGQYVLGRIDASIKPGQVAIVQWNGQALLKRVKEMNGERFFMEGDNKFASLDSWDIGWLPKKAILAKAIMY